ncbi:MAG: macro domain-containing protein [Candidatus Desantisbacteria bacterium]
MEKKIKDVVLRLVEGDITGLSVDAIVNAAGPSLVMGGGVAGAILKKGGRKIQEECDKIGGTSCGTAVITGAGNLSVRYVIHAVGPRAGEGQEDEKLKSATLSALKLADEYKLKSIAFPAISAGIFGYPIDKSAHIMLSTCLEYINQNKTSLSEIIFCLFGKPAFSSFRNELNSLNCLNGS